jgi:hypothetical protein
MGTLNLGLLFEELAEVARVHLLALFRSQALEDPRVGALAENLQILFCEPLFTQQLIPLTLIASAGGVCPRSHRGSRQRGGREGHGRRRTDVEQRRSLRQSSRLIRCRRG